MTRDVPGRRFRRDAGRLRWERCEMDGGPGDGVPPEQGHVEWPLTLRGGCGLRGGTDLESSSVHLSGSWGPFDSWPGLETFSVRGGFDCRLAFEFPPKDLLCWERSEFFTCGLCWLG